MVGPDGGIRYIDGEEVSQDHQVKSAEPEKMI